MSHTFLVSFRFYDREPGDVERFARFIHRLGGDVLDDGERPYGNVGMRICIDQDDEEFVRSFRPVGRLVRPESGPRITLEMWLEQWRAYLAARGQGVVVDSGAEADTWRT